jgi:DNA polymerase (family 10)
MANHPGNVPVVRELSRLATLMEIAGENPFRIRAIRTGAEAVGGMEEPVAVFAADSGLLRSIPGIGSGIAALIQEIVATGTTASIEAIADRAPAGLIDVMEMPGIGAKTASKLFKLADVRGIETLAAAIESGTIANTPGLGPNLARKLQAGLDLFAKRSGRTPITVALPIAADILNRLASVIGQEHRLAITGSVRRWEETVDDINMLTTAPPELIKARAEAAGIEAARIVDGAVVGRYTSGISIVVIGSTVARWGTDLVRTTGPVAHLELLGEGARSPFEGETALYSAIGLPYIEPEFRQGLGEVDLARSGQLSDIITIGDITGEFHCHTVWSDGQNTVEEMVLAAQARGYRYLGISDHSHSLGVANGLSRERLLEQAEEIRSVSNALGFPVLRGSEVEVRRDGSLDFDDQTLHGLDAVIASTHSGLTAPRPDLMQRLGTALTGGRVDLLAHPSGRLIGRREPGDFDWPKVYELAASRGVALEINADPARLDLNGEHAREAVEAGCLIAINCDAHSTSGFASMEYGLKVARRGFVPAGRVINAWPLERFRAWLSSPEIRQGT